MAEFVILSCSVIALGVWLFNLKRKGCNRRKALFAQDSNPQSSSSTVG